MTYRNGSFENRAGSQRPKKPGTLKRSADGIRVIVIDDHPAIQEAVALTVDSNMDMTFCGSAGSVDAAFQLVEDVKPDVAVIDISLEDSHGLDLVKNFHSQYSQMQMVIFSMHDERVYARRALRAGASGYVMKSASTQNVAEAIRTVARGEIYLSPRMASRLLNSMMGRERYRSDTSAEELADLIDELTDREMEVFHMMGRGYNASEIAERLNLGRKTVETYRRRAKEKLGFETVPELLHFATQWMVEDKASRGSVK